MKFADIRTTITKRTVADQQPASAEATPRRISPYTTDKVTVQHGVDSVDILHPAYNRARRRAVGNVRPRRRIPGVAVPATRQPWKPQPTNTEEKAA